MLPRGTRRGRGPRRRPPARRRSATGASAPRAPRRRELNDCWPVTSWSAVDGDGRRKPLRYALRRAYADRLLTVQDGEQGAEVAVVNDADRPWQGEPLVARLGDRRAVSFFAEDTAVAYPRAAYDAAAEPVEGGYRVTVTARTLLRELALFPDRLDPAASVDDLLLTLLPGEVAAFHVATERPLDPGALTTPPVLRCVNEAGVDGAGVDGAGVGRAGP